MPPPPTVRPRAWFAFASLMTCATAAATAETATPGSGGGNLGAAGTPAPHTWEFNGNVRSALGYKDNLLLSAVRSEGSAFAQAEGEVFLWRLPTDRFEALAFANGSFTRFLASDADPQEWQAFAHAEARWFITTRWQTTATVEGYHLDQVFDLSVSNVDRQTARLAVDGGLASAELRWDLRPDTWLALKPAGQRDRYRDGSDDNRQRIVRATVGHSFFAGRVELAVSAQTLRRDYDRRPKYTGAGRRLAGTVLGFQQREDEVRVAVAWDQAERWTTTTTAAVASNDDNGSGFFDYHQRSLRQEIAWKRAPWSVRLVGRAGRYDYDVQTEGIGIDPPKRLKEEFRAQLRVERQWTKRARLYTDFAWDRSRSNDPLASYRVKTASAGVEWAL